MCVAAQIFACTACAALCVNAHRDLWVDIGRKRQNPKQRSCGIATRICNKSRLAGKRALPFDKPIDSMLEILCVDMLRVVLLIRLSAQAIICRQVDNLQPQCERFFGAFHRLFVRQCEKHKFAAFSCLAHICHMHRLLQISPNSCASSIYLRSFHFLHNMQA